MTTLQILEKARELIEKPERWTKKEFARNAAGVGLGRGFRDSGEAPVCFCLDGALIQASEDERWKAIEALGFKDTSELYDFNDESSHAEVLARLDSAISKLKSEQAVQQ